MANGVGGQSLTKLYPIDSTHTTITSTASLTLDEQVKTDIQKDGVQFDTIKFDPAIFGFIQTNGSTSGSSTAETVTLETTTSRSTGTAASQANFISVSYGAIVVDGTDHLITVAVTVGVVDDTSGAYSIEANKFSRPTFKVASIAAKKDITLPNGLLESTLVDTAAVGYVAPIIKMNVSKPQTFFLPLKA